MFQRVKDVIMCNLCNSIFYMETSIFKDFHICVIYLNFSLIVLHISPSLAKFFGFVFKLRFLITRKLSFEDSCVFLCSLNGFTLSSFNMIRLRVLDYLWRFNCIPKGLVICCFVTFFVLLKILAHLFISLLFSWQFSLVLRFCFNLFLKHDLYIAALCRSWVTVP